jgi:predicted anti-sigma-YlaC factor YlaD
MTCAELRQRFPAYAGGRLSDIEAAALESHLAACATCEAWLDTAEGPLPDTRSLPRSVNPASDLWPGIQARLPLRSRGRIVIARWVLAAAAVLLVAVSSGLTAVLLRQSSSRPAVQSSGNLQSLEAQYAAASDDLTQALEKARSRLAPATIATIERNLGIVDAALAESRGALAKDPGNAALAELVTAAWRQKVDLLRRATALGTKT